MFNYDTVLIEVNAKTVKWRHIEISLSQYLQHAVTNTGTVGSNASTNTNTNAVTVSRMSGQY